MKKQNLVLLFALLQTFLLMGSNCGANLQRRARIEKLQDLYDPSRLKNVPLSRKEADKIREMSAPAVDFLAKNLSNAEVDTLLKFQNSLTNQKFESKCGNQLGIGIRSLPEIGSDTAKCMAQHLTAEEVKELASFYESDLGAKIMALIPELERLEFRASLQHRINAGAL